MTGNFIKNVSVSTKQAVASMLALLLVLAPALSAREQCTIQKSATDLQLRAADATLNQASPTNNYSGSPTFTVQSRSQNRNERALIQFDLSPLPNVGVKAASMILSFSSFPGAARTYRTYGVTSFYSEGSVSWTNRFTTATPASSTAWGAAGGDYNGTATDSETIPSNGTTCPATRATTVTFDVTNDVLNAYNGGTNFGEEIIDSAENSGITRTTNFYSKEATNSACAPQLQVTYMQNVSNLTATPGNGSITLNWTNPTPLTGATVLEPYQGTLILRRATAPVDKNSYPTDGNNPAMCSTLGNGTVVFNNMTNANTFTDSGACGGLTNGTTYFYKVFVRDSANNYSTQSANGTTSSAYTAEVSATPAATAANRYSSNWVDATYSNDLGAPSVYPNDVIMVGTGTDLLFGVSATNGVRPYPPVSLGGAVTSRSPIIGAAQSVLGEDVIYVGDSSGYLYGIASATGQILWVVDPNGSTTNAFTGGAAVRIASLLGTGVLPYDLVVLGTNIAGNTSGNQIIGVNGSTGAMVWTVTGNSGSNPKMDIINSTPLIDYKNNAIWVTSRSAGGTAQPSLWKLNPTNGAVLATAKLGDTDSSPALNDAGTVLFVGTNAGVIYAINPATGQPFSASSNYNANDAAIVGYPIAVTSTTPNDTVIFSGSANVHAVNYNTSTNTFSAAWSTPVTVPSAPITFTGLGTVYVGGNDGLIHEINLATGVDDFDVTVNLLNGYNNEPAFVGNPSLDLLLNRVYVSTNDQRAYSFPFPF
ncbi:MAG TPA: DNRLRE domain-containing protein [Candidatus Acidoferrum sp.]|nr:DNRLRE domain-containing protein [Candidatus Acidoferrum sp.]